MSNEDSELSLPADTLAILNEFLREKAEREEQELKCISGQSENASMFEEDWQLSQFWYDQKTKDDVKTVVQKVIQADQKIGLLSCPSLYSTIKSVHDNVKIFEYDKRFSAFGDDFVFYDFNEALNEPSYLSDYTDYFDLIVADPPFLSEECIQKTAHIVEKIRKSDAKVIFCSGKIVEPWVTKFLNLKMCNFQPQHERNLGNEFVSFANFNLDEFL